MNLVSICAHPEACPSGVLVIVFRSFKLLPRRNLADAARVSNSLDQSFHEPRLNTKSTKDMFSMSRFIDGVSNEFEVFARLEATRERQPCLAQLRLRDVNMKKDNILLICITLEACGTSFARTNVTL